MALVAVNADEANEIASTVLTVPYAYVHPTYNIPVTTYHLLSHSPVVSHTAASVRLVAQSPLASYLPASIRLVANSPIAGSVAAPLHLVPHSPVVSSIAASLPLVAHPPIVAFSPPHNTIQYVAVNPSPLSEMNPINDSTPAEDVEINIRNESDLPAEDEQPEENETSTTFETPEETEITTEDEHPEEGGIEI